MVSTYKFHKIDQTVPMLPSLKSITTESWYLNILRLIQLVQSFGEQIHCIVDQSSLRLKKLFNKLLTDNKFSNYLQRCVVAFGRILQKCIVKC